MALMNPLRPAYITDAQLYPAMYYARPAMSPMAVGGRFGYTQQHLTDQYKYTLQQMAVSPYSVNNEAYMERIRKQYGLDDRAQYKLYGNIGGFLGAGLGVAFSLGFINNPKMWLKGQVFSSLNPKVLAVRQARNMALTPKGRTSKYATTGTLAFIKNAKFVKSYNNTLTALSDAKNVFDAATQALTNAQAAQQVAEKTLQNARRSVSEILQDVQKGQTVILDSVTDLQKAADAAKETTKLAVNTYNSAADALRTAQNTTETAYKALKAADKAFDGVELGTKAAAKAGGFMPVVGIAMDAASLGLSSASFIDALNSGDIKGSWINGVATFLDAVALGTDFVPGIGDVISVVASLASAALTGGYSGQTVGHSLSPSGLQAQANFFKNLGASIQARPISTTASLLTMFAVQGLARIGARRQSSWSRFWTSTALGNLGRTSVTMGLMQLVNKGTSWVEEQLNMAPDDASEVNFTNSIGIWGDINDNLFGATLRKSQLGALTNKDTNVTFSDMYEKSWGISQNPDEIYHSIMFADVREGAGLDTGVPILNSIIDIVGETIVDPQNYVEAYESSVRGKAKEVAVELLENDFKKAAEIVRLKQAALLEKDPKAVLKTDPLDNPIEFLVGADGIFRGAMEERKIMLRQLLDSYLEDGDAGLRKSVSDHQVIREKGSMGSVEIREASTKVNIDTVTKLFHSIFETNSFKSLRYTSDLDIAEYRRRLEALATVDDLVKNKIDLTKDQEVIKARAIETMKRLESYYGDKESSVALVDRFLKDLDITLSNKQLRGIYAVHSDVKFHTDLAGGISDISTWLFMPLQKILGSAALRKAFKSLASFSRSVIETKKTSAKTIIQVAEVFKDIKKNYTFKDVEVLMKNANTPSDNKLDDLLAKSTVDHEDLVANEIKAMHEKVSEAEQNFNNTKKLIKGYSDALKEQAEELKSAKEILFVPTEVGYKGTDDYVSIKDEADAKAQLNEAIRFEETVIEPTGLTIAQFLRRNKDSAAAKHYESQKIAAAMFYQHVVYRLMFDASAEQQQYITSLVASLNADHAKEEINLLKASGYFRTYINDSIVRPRKELVEELVVRYTEAQKQKEVELAELEKEKDRAKTSLEDLAKKIDEQKKELAGTKDDARTAFLTINIEELTATKDALFKKWLDVEDDIKHTRVRREHFENLVKFNQKEADKIANYEATKARIEASGEKWDDKKHFDPETMQRNMPETMKVFNNLKWDKETELLTEIQKILLRNGVVYKYITMEKDATTGKLKEVEHIIEFKEQKFLDIPEGASLQVEYRTTLTGAFYGAIADVLALRPEDINLANMYKNLIGDDGKELDFDNWLKLGPQKQKDYVIEALNNMNLSKEQQKLLDGGTIRTLISAISKAVYTHGVVREPLNQLNETVLRRVVVYNLQKSNSAYKAKYESIFRNLDELQEKIKQLREEASKKGGEEKAILLSVIDGHVHAFNRYFSNLSAYKYLRDSVIQRNVKDTGTELFVDYADLRGNVLPAYANIKELTDNPLASIKPLEDVLVDYVESEGFKAAMEFAKDSITYAKHVSADEVTTEDEAYLKSREETKQLTAEEDERVDELTKKVKERVDEIAGDTKAYNVTGVKIINNLNTASKIAHQPFEKDLHGEKNDKFKQAQQEIFGYTMYPRDYSTTIVELSPRMFFTGADKKIPTGYYKLLAEKSRTSEGQRKALRIFAEYLYHTLKASKGSLTINEDKLAKGQYLRIGLDLDTDQGKQEYFVRKVVETYVRSDKDATVQIIYKNDGKNTESTRQFRAILLKKVADYANAHRTEDMFATYDKDSDGLLTREAVQEFSKALGDSTESDTKLYELKKDIWERATDIFERAKVRNNGYLGNILKHLDKVHQYEAEDSKSLSEAIWTVSYDVFNKLAYDTPKMIRLLDAIIDYDGIKDTGVKTLDIIKLIDDDLIEDYEGKEPFIASDYVGAKIEAGDVYFQKKDNTYTSLHNVLFKQRVSIKRLRNFLNNPKISIPADLRAEIEVKFVELTNKDKGILNYDPIDVSKDVFLKAGGTEKDWDFIENNPELGSVFQTLVLDMNLKYSDKGAANKGSLEQVINYMRLLYDPYIFTLYKESLKGDTSSYFDSIVKAGLDNERISQALKQKVWFGFLVLNATKVSPQAKAALINNVFFYNAYVGKADYDKEELNKYTAEIARLKDRTDLQSKNTVTVLQNKLAMAERVKKNLAYGFLEDPKQRAEYFIKHPEKLGDFFGFYRDTAEPDKYIMALDKHDKYILLEKREDHNYEIEGKGVVSRINLTVKDILDNSHDGAEHTYIQEKMKSSVLWSGLDLSKIVEVVIDRQGNLLLVTKNSIKKDKQGKVYENVDTALHEEINKKRKALLAEINLDKPKDLLQSIYTVSEKQYKEIKDTKKEDLPTEPVYRAIEIKDKSGRGTDRYVGQTPQLVTTNSAKSLVNAYVSDITKLDGIEKKITKEDGKKYTSYEEFFEALVKYTEIHSKYPVLSQAYYTHKPFSSTQKLKNLQNTAKSLRVYYDFVQTLKANGIDIEPVDLDMLTKHFFKHTYIKQDATGKLYDLKDLRDSVDADVWASFEAEGDIDKIVSTLEALQLQYGASDVMINGEHTAPAEFLDTLKTLTSTAAGVLRHLGNYGRKLQDEVFKVLDKQYDSGYEYGAQLEEFADRLNLNNSLLDSVGIDFQNSTSPLRDPIRNAAAFETAIKNLKKDFYENQESIMENSLALERAHAKQRKDFNKTLKNRRENTLNMTQFWAWYRAYKNYVPTNNMIFKYENEELRKVAEVLFEIVKQYQQDKTSVSEAHQEQLKDLFALPNISTLEKMLEKLKSADKLYNLLINGTLLKYMNNIRSHVAPSIADLNKSLMRPGITPEEQAKLNEDYDKIIAEKTRYKLNTGYRIARKSPLSDKVGLSLDRAQGIRLKNLTKHSVTVDFLKLATDLVDAMESALFNKNKDTLFEKNRELLIATLKENDRTKELPNSLAKYYETILNKGKRLEVETLINSIIFRKESIMSEEDLDTILEQESDPRFLEHAVRDAYKILKGQGTATKKKTYTAQQVWESMRIPLLDNSREFMDYFLHRYLTVSDKERYMLNMFGIKDDDYKYFMSGRTVQDALNSIRIHDKDSTFRPANMYALVHVLNTAKMMYMSENNKGADFKLATAWFEHTRKPVRDAELAIKNMNKMHGFTGAYDSNIVREIYEDTGFIFDALTTVKQFNETLQTRIITLDEKQSEVNSARTKFVRQSETQSLTEAKKLQRSLSSVFFKEELTMNTDSKQYYDLLRELSEGSLHIINEAHADRIENVASTNKYYKEIMYTFNDAVKLIMRDLLEDKNFIRMAEVAVTLTSLKESKEFALYANVFDDFVLERKKDVPDLLDKEIDAALEKIIDVFAKSTKLVELDKTAVKAILGKLLYDRFKDTYRINLDAKTFKEYSRTVVNARYTRYMGQLGTIAHRIQAAKDDDEIAQVIFGKSLNELKTSKDLNDRDAYNAITLVKSLRGLIQAGITLTPEYLYDTYVEAVRVDQPYRKEENVHTRMFSSASTLYNTANATLTRYENSFQSALNAEGISEAELATIKNKKDALEAERALKQQEVEGLDELIVQLSQDKDQELKNIYRDILVRHPVLLQEYLQGQETYVEKSIKRIQSLQDKINLRYSKTLQELVNKRLQTLDELETLKKSFRFKTYNEYRTLSRADAAQKIWDALSGTQRASLKFTQVSDVVTWLNKTATEVKKLDDTLKAYKQNPIEMRDDKGMLLPIKRKINRYVKESEALRKEEAHLADLKDKLLITPEDAAKDDELIKTVVTKFANKYFANTSDISKKEFFKLLETQEVDAKKPNAFTEAQKTKLLEMYNERLLGVEKALASRLTKYADMKFIKQLYPADHSNNQKIVVIEKILKSLEEKKVAYEAAIKHLNSLESYTAKELLAAGFEAFTTKNNIEFEANVEDLINLLLGETATEFKQDIADAKTKRNTLTDTDIAQLTKRINRYDNLLELPAQIKAQQELVKQYEQNRDAAEQNMLRAQEVHKEAHPHGNSNLGTYKNLKGIPRDGDLSKQDADTLNSIIHTTATDPFQGTDKSADFLKAEIEKAGNFDIHNPVVDTLITRLNYLEQTGKTNDADFFVLDMETIHHEGQDIPYQMTILHNEAGGKLTIQNVYFNSIAFHREEIDTKTGKPIDTPTITQFKKDLYNMYKERVEKNKSTAELQYKLTSIESDELRTKAEQDAENIINIVKTQKNNQEFVQAYLDIFNHANNNKIPVVTHAGDRFDIPNYTTFIKRYASTLLTNMYYANIYTKNPDQIMERYGVSSFKKLDDMGDEIKDTLLTTVDAELKTLLAKFDNAVKNKTYEQITDSEFKQITLLNEAVYRMHISRHLRVLEEQFGIHIDDTVKTELFDSTTGQSVQVKTMVGNWLAAEGAWKDVYRAQLLEYYKEAINLNPQRDTSHDYTKELETKIDKLLAEIEKRYKDIKQNNTAIIYELLQKNSNRDKIVAGVFTPEQTRVEYRAQEFAEGYARQIESLLSTKEMLNTLSPNTLQETVARLEADAELLEKNKDDLLVLKNALEEKIASTNKDADEYLEGLVRFASKIQDRTNKLLYQSRKAVSTANIELFRAGRNSSINPLDEASLNWGIAETLKDMNDLVKQIESLIKIAQKLAADEEAPKAFYEIEWFKYNTASEVAAAKKALTDSIERFDTQIKDLEVHTSYKDLTLKKDLEEHFARIKEAQKNSFLESIKEYNTIARKYRLLELSTDTAPDAEAVKVFFDTLKQTGTDIYDMIKRAGVSTEKYLKEFPEVSTLLDLTKTGGKLSRAYDVIRTSDKEEVYDKYRTALIAGLQQSKSNVEAELVALDNYKIGDKKNNSIELLNAQLKKLLNAVNRGDLIQEELQANSILNIVSGKDKPSTQMSDEEFVAAATRRMDKEFLDATQDPTATRLYDTALRHNNKKAFMLKEDTVYYKPTISEDGSVTYVFNFFDQTTQSVNQITVNTKNPDSPKTNLKYVYRYANRPLDRPREILLPKLQFTTTEEEYGNTIVSFLDTTKTIDNFYKDINISSANVYKENNRDGSFESIRRALLFYKDEMRKAIKKLPNDYYKMTKEQQVSAFNKAFEDILKKSVNAYELHLKTLDVVDMTKRTENMFLEYVKTARLLVGKRGFRDAAGVYQGLSDRLLAKYNSLVPGKILNLIAPEFATDFIIKYDDEALYEKNIDLYNSSEGSMGSSFMERSPYTTHLPFKHNTNSIRIGLSNTQQYKSYTSIGVANVLYLAEDEFFKTHEREKNYDNDITKYLNALKPADGDYSKRVVMLKDKTLTTYDKVAQESRKDIILEYTEESVNRLTEILKPNAFIPKVVSAEDKEKYLKDIIHKRGVNLSVTFANDARAFEDVMLFDYDDATALGWNKGYKTWLGLYGFKGGVRLVKGLRAQYGTSLVASATSVVKRGAYGALIEMLISNLNDAHSAYKAGKLSSKDKYYKLVKEYEKPSSVLHKYVTFEDGFALVKPNINYAEFFKETSLFGEYSTAKTDKERYTSIFDDYLANKTRGKAKYNYTLKGERTEVTTDISTGWQGTLYVSLDAEHITEKLYNKAELRNYGGISVAQVDSTGTVLNGVVFSEAVLYPMLAKASDNDMNWARAFYDEDNPNQVMFNDPYVQQYSKLASYGIKYFFDAGYIVTRGDGYDINATLTALDALGINKNIKQYVVEYLTHEHFFKTARLSNPELNLDLEYKHAEINKKIRQEAHDHLVGDNGALRSSLFKKYFGGRQQLLANTDLKLGNVITNVAIWENNAAHDANWINIEAYDTKEFEQDILKHEYESTGKTKTWTKNADGTYSITAADTYELKDILLLLSRNGIINAKVSDNVYKEDMYSVVETDKGTTVTIKQVEVTQADGTKTTTLARKFGWMLGLRAPVQDYNAVSLIKVIGYHDHNALEADKYLYLRIGGDNDGDTLGMIAINSKQYKYLTPLDSTKERFYDAGYFAKVDEDYIKETISGYVTPDQPTIEGVDITDANVGKFAFSKFQDVDGKLKKIRDKYTTSELYIQTFTEHNLEKYITDKQENKKLRELYPELEKTFKEDIKLVRTYVNAYIRRKTGGYDFTKEFKLSDYSDIKKMLAYITKEKALDNVLGRYAFDRALAEHKIHIEDYVKISTKDIYNVFYSLDQEDQKNLAKDYQMFNEDKSVNKYNTLKNFLEVSTKNSERIIKEVITNKILNRLFQVTVERVQASKIGINYYGGNRKNQMASVMLSRFMLVNQDAKGDFWKHIGAYGAAGELTPTTILNALFKEDFTKALKTGVYASLDKAVEIGKTSLKDSFAVKLNGKEETKTLLQLMQYIFKDNPILDGEEVVITNKEVDAFVEEAITVIYKAHINAVRAEKIFTALGKALNSTSGYTFVDFFAEKFPTDRGMLELDDELSPMLKIVKESKKEKLDPLELEWVKIQFWGANKKDADAFIKLVRNPSELAELIKTYKDSYLNEHIISRKDFKKLSDKATEIIGFAKHFGSDVQTYKYMKTYMQTVLDESSAHRVRTTNIDPDRSFINFSIAMNRNPFEDEKSLEITDEPYELLKKEKNLGKRAVLENKYANKGEALSNLREITRDTFDVQLLGRLGVHKEIHNFVHDKITEFLTIFNDPKYNLATTEGLISASKAAEEVAKVLVAFNISGYKLRNFVLNYMYDYSYINNVLIRNNQDLIRLDERDPLLINAAGFTELLFKIATRYHQDRYNELLKTEAPLVNSILQSSLEIDDDFYEYDDDGNLSQRVNSSNMYANMLHKDDVQETMSNIILDKSTLPTKLLSEPTAKENKILRVFLKELELNVSNKHTDFKETLDELMREYYLLHEIYYADTKKKEQLGDVIEQSPETERLKAVKHRVTNYKLIEDDLRNLFRLQSEYAKNKNELAEQERKLNIVNTKLETVRNQQETIDSLVNKETGHLSNSKTIKEQMTDIDNKVADLKKKIESTDDKILSYVFNDVFSPMLPLLHTKDGSTIRNLYYYDTPKYLTDKDTKQYTDEVLLKMHSYMSSFIDGIKGFEKFDDNGQPYIDYKEAYAWLVDRYDFIRVAIIRKPDDTEGLARSLITETYKEVTKHGKKKPRPMFREAKDLEDYMKHIKDAANLGEEQEPILFHGVPYQGLSKDALTTKGFLTPTLKEINIRSPKDLQTLYEGVLNDLETGSLVGFVTINNIMDAYDLAYILYRQTGFASGLINKLIIASKFLQRLNLGFLIRNWIDTWNQLYSEAQQKFGNIGVIFKIPEILKIMRGVSHIKSVYQRVSLDRILYLSAFKGHYEELRGILDTKKVITPKEQARLLELVDINVRVLESYRDAKLDTDEFSSRVMLKQQRVQDIITALNRLKDSAKSDINILRSAQGYRVLENGVNFIGSMKFAEYFVMYDKLADVFDATKLYESKNTSYIAHIKKLESKHWEEFKRDLFQTSAFMQTHAQKDEYQADQQKTINTVLEEMLTPDKQSLKSYTEISAELDKALSAEISLFGGALKKTMLPWIKGGNLTGLYSWITADTETSGRLVGFFLDQHLHDLTFEQSVQKSLTRFFDYGALSPLEKNMIVDIPYLSFPIRSINNWINRLCDPRYLRHLSDLLDGIYGQYTDEDGQFDKYTKYQMANGWVPIAGGVGLRAGNGAFDVLELISNPSEQIAQRRGPIGRMMAAFVDYLTIEERDEDKLLSDIIKQSAVSGFATRVINQISATNPDIRTDLSQIPVVNNIVNTKIPGSVQQGVAQGSSVTFWYDNNYEKYSPKKYQYSKGNGRYKYYENIYKDWFTKYGRMRVPKVDPYSLVKEIQWKQYVRSRQNKYR